ncbi:site-specific DNA-methyltransferase [uncultured Friedmanniella sp.]|uniref:site-specific DNA-methyltransferase n=1 Tax=uncultured Friedmanniella sp. TaxID=335381 RepID=UPI0035CA38E0
MPPRSRKPAGATPVEAIKHTDKRVNLPTADAVEDFGTEELDTVQQVRYPRDPTLDPQLVWRGKDTESADLVADAAPIYIQEKIDPRVLVENLRRTSKGEEPEPEATLFESFDGLNELDIVDFYAHQANWSNRMILGDSLQVMASLAERESLRGQVQMIYIDPPYGIKFGSNWQASTRKRDVKDGKLEDAAREAEQIKAFRDTWELGIHSYLSYLRDRLLAARDLLTESGSVFVQIGDENVHLVRSLMDEVLGSDNFIAQVAFKKTSAVGSFSGGTTTLASTCDYVIWFAKNLESTKFRQLYRGKSPESTGASAYRTIEEPNGILRPATVSERAGGRTTGRLLRASPLTSDMVRSGQTTVFPVDFNGILFTPGNKGWKTNKVGMKNLGYARRLMATDSSLSYVRYLDDFPAYPVTNLWDDTQSGSAMDKIYVVQTNVKVIERCMLMCTDPGDLVLDPTCGSGTTAYVAEQWGRRWITIDTSRVALALARQRVMGARFPYYLKADSVEGRAKEQEVSQKLLPPAEVTNDIRHGFVYERVQHITLKSIANNPDIYEGMSREDIDRAIKKHAEFEVLYDKPYEDKNKVRVAGPFTVESLSPHRSPAFTGTTDEANRESISQQAAATDAEAPSFEQSILDNLAKAGIQNGRRDERITFATTESYAGAYLQAIGVQDDESGSRIGIAIGPQYGTVSQGIIKNAAREAIRAGNVDLVVVLGFAFDAQATDVTESDGVTVEASVEGFANVAGERRVGRIPVLLVRMNVDLLMGEDLKKTGAGNLFTIFGEPDIEIRTLDDGQLVVDLKGVDVFDPTTGEVRSRTTDRIALWMIDTNYNQESFFVRHCYFTGGNDPYKRLKVALKADIDPDAWASLYRTESRPFERPETGQIAVKVINDYGDEVMKVFDV